MYLLLQVAPQITFIKMNYSTPKFISTKIDIDNNFKVKSLFYERKPYQLYFLTYYPKTPSRIAKVTRK